MKINFLEYPTVVWCPLSREPCAYPHKLNIASNWSHWATYSPWIMWVYLCSNFHDSSGTNDKSFLSAVSTWAVKAGISPVPRAPFSDCWKVWDSVLVSVTRKSLLSAAPFEMAKADLLWRRHLTLARSSTLVLVCH